MRLPSNTSIALAGLVFIFLPSFANGQGYGTDAQNVLTPAAGGMAGVSIALPQDVPAAVFGNPATLAQFKGTQFTLGGAWVEGYPTVTRHGFLNPDENFSVTSRTQGFVIPVRRRRSGPAKPRPARHFRPRSGWYQWSRG